jgi:hypothetical protein
MGGRASSHGIGQCGIRTTRPLAPKGTGGYPPVDFACFQPNAHWLYNGSGTFIDSPLSASLVEADPLVQKILKICVVHGKLGICRLSANGQ